ncbi:MAG: hypothetical protein Phog2KO_25540 [Phototrophicaceae bacterium]
MLNRIILLVVLIFALVGCNRSLDVQPNGDGTSTITVGLTESEINTVITTALNTAENPLLSNPSVDLQTGQIVVSGDYQRQDGSGTASGTITLQVSVANGEIQAQVTNVNVEGWDASDERIQQFNQRLETALATVAQQNNANASLDRITITNDMLDISITIQTPQFGN